MSAAVLAAARRAQILVEVKQARAINVTDLSRRFGVSDMTVRRDLDVLARAGRLTRVHGGAMAFDPLDAASAASRPAPSAADVALARVAGRLVRPSSTVAIAGGPRAFALAGWVSAMKSVNVVTNSLWVALLMHEHGRGASTRVLGGLGTPSGGLSGPGCAEALRNVDIDMVFLDPDGIDARAGLTTAHLADAAADAALVGVARRVVALSPSSVWGKVNFCPVAPLEMLDTLVTDDLTDRMRRELGHSVRHVVTARNVDGPELLLPRKNVAAQRAVAPGLRTVPRNAVR